MDNTTKDRPATLSTPGLRAAIRVRTVAKLVGLLALTALFAVACRHPVGLFASLEEEIAVDEDRGVPTSDGMQEMLLSSTKDHYYAAFTSLYVRKAAEDLDLDDRGDREEWSKVAKPDGLGEDDTLGSIAEYSDEIYAVYDGEVYRRPNDGGTGSGDWVDVADPSAGRASRLFAAASTLLVSVRTDSEVGEDDDRVGEYQLYEWDNNNPDDWDNSAVDFGTTDDVVSFVYAVEEVGGNFFVATDGNIYSNGDFTSEFNTQDTGITSGSYRELLAVDKTGDDTDDTLYAAAKGRILSYDGSDWNAGNEQTEDDEPVQFTSLGWYTDSRVIDDSDASNGYLIAGSLDNGLYEAEDGDVNDLAYEGAESALFGRGGNYLTTQLSENGIQKIFVDDPGQGSWRSDGPHIFIGAAGRGLWRGEFDEDPELNDVYWRRE